MSKNFLQSLNAGNNGRFKNYIDSLTEAPQISWYPSAGRDFRDLVFLSQRYAEYNPANPVEKVFPTVFLHTDYYPTLAGGIPDAGVLYEDDQTQVSAEHTEELPRIALPLDDDIVSFSHDARAEGNLGRVLYREVKVETVTFGTIYAPLLYVFAENEAFCALKMLPHGAVVSHVVHVRYGGGHGGGLASGSWLLSVLARLQTRYFLTDGHLHEQNGDLAAYQHYPILGADPRPVHRNTIRTIPVAIGQATAM